jgi:hypothetical protein
VRAATGLDRVWLSETAATKWLSHLINPAAQYALGACGSEGGGRGSAEWQAYPASLSAGGCIYRWTSFISFLSVTESREGPATLSELYTRRHLHGKADELRTTDMHVYTH